MCIRDRDRNLDELTAGVRRHYENGYSNIGEFIEAHDDRLPPELMELAKQQVGNVGGYPYWSWYGFNSRVEWCACFVRCV